MTTSAVGVWWFVIKNTLIHWTNKRIYTKFAQRKYDASICFFQSKPVANMENATFAIVFTQVCKYGSKCGIYHVCCRFALEETYVSNLLPLCKFGINPCFLPVIYSFSFLYRRCESFFFFFFFFSRALTHLTSDCWLDETKGTFQCKLSLNPQEIFRPPRMAPMSLSNR